MDHLHGDDLDDDYVQDDFVYVGGDDDAVSISEEEEEFSGFAGEGSEAASPSASAKAVEDALKLKKRKRREKEKEKRAKVESPQIPALTELADLETIEIITEAPLGGVDASERFLLHICPTSSFTFRISGKATSENIFEAISCRVG